MVGIGVIQMAAEPLKVQENLKKAANYISRTAENGAKIVVLPEMFSVGFSTNEKLMNLAEALDGYTVTWLKKQAERHGVYIITSVYEKFEDRFYNTMVMVGGDGSLQFYRKRNPTCQERLVWKRFEKPGPGVFETPFGRVGGAICFDSFSKETFEGFRRSNVDIIIIVALWGTIIPMLKHPDSFFFNKLLRYQSYLASEIVPKKYAEELKIPAVYVNQCGKVNLPVAHPRLYPSPNWANSKYQFVGNSNVFDKTGNKLLKGFDSYRDFSTVAHVDMPGAKKRSAPSKIDMPPEYMSKKYYFVEPPYMFRLYQKLCFTGFKNEYNRLCLKYKQPLM